jgi:hypothetical protein
VDVAVRREEVVHDDEVNLAPSRQLDTMKAIETGQQGVRVGLDMLMVVLEDGAKKFVLRVRDRFDDEPVVAREVEERPRLSGRAEFGQDVFGGEREQVVGGVQVEMFLAQVAKDPRRVVLEFEVVLGRRSELIADAVGQLQQPQANSHVEGVFVSC